MIQIIKLSLLGLCILVVGCTAKLAPNSVAVIEPSLISLEDLARAPDIYSLALDPGGNRIAFIETVDGRGEIRVRDLTSDVVTPIYRDSERSLSNVSWSGDGRWLVYLQDAGGDEGYHLFRLDPDNPSAPPADLTPFTKVEASIVRMPRNVGGIAIVAINRRDPQFPDAFAINLASGVATEVVRNEKDFTEYAADAHGRVLAAQSITNDGFILLWTRLSEGEAWREIYRSPPGERFALQELAPDGKSAIIRTNRDRAVERVARLDLASGVVTDIAGNGCGRYDESKVYLNALGESVLRACIMERSALLSLQKRSDEAMTEVRKLVGSQASIELESASADYSTMLFYSDKSDRPGQFVLVKNNKASRYAKLFPWLEGKRFQPSEARWIKARDGLPLLTYLTLPQKGAQSSPLIISIHGGPWSRDIGGYERNTQLLVDRGYAVLQVNFRGSTGLGKAIAEAAVGEFGAGMSDDIVDAASWAVEHGIADPNRMCVMGGSYGGYATLVAMTRDSGLFSCGIDFAGPADLVTLMESFPPSWQPYLPRSWYRFVGDPRDRKDRARMSERSPIHQIDHLTAPMLIFQGANDPRVTQEQSDLIVCGLRARDISVDYLLAASEGHSFGNEETSLAVNRAMEEFLALHLGGRMAPNASDRTENALKNLRAAGAAIICPQQTAKSPTG